MTLGVQYMPRSSTPITAMYYMFANRCCPVARILLHTSRKEPASIYYVPIIRTMTTVVLHRIMPAKNRHIPQIRSDFCTNQGQ
jgi:hypothetical protein